MLLHIFAKVNLLQKAPQQRHNLSLFIAQGQCVDGIVYGLGYGKHGANHTRLSSGLKTARERGQQRLVDVRLRVTTEQIQEWLEVFLRMRGNRQ